MDNQPKLECGPTDNALEVSVVLPVYRNAEIVHELHRRLSRALDAESLRYEIIFVDDACPAGSLAVLEELARRDPHVAVIALERNVGQHRAVLAGLAHVRGRWATVMDADLQDPPEAIPELLAKIRDGFDAVFAGRRGRYEPMHRLITSRLFKWLLHVVSGVPVDAGMFVVMSRRMVQRLLTFAVRRPFVVAMIGCTGLPVASIPVARSRRPAGRSAYSSWKRLKTGCLTIAGAIKWRLFRRRRGASDRVAPAPVKARIGARFTSA